MTTFHLGIDVAKAKLDCALRRPDGKFKSKVFSNDASGHAALLQWLQGQGATTAHVCMEATGIYWEDIAEFLAGRQYPVSVVNPAQIKAYGASRLVRTKTDRVDARLIADYACTNNPPLWQAPSDSEQVLRALVLRVQALQTMHTQESNRLEVARPAVRDRIATHLAWLDAEIKALRKAIHQHIDEDPTLGERQALLDSIPGLGEATIALLLAYAIHPGRFANARQVAAYAGLDPRQHDSGTSVHQPAQLSKVGHTALRAGLYFPAMSALYRTAWGQRFGARLAANHKPPMVIIGAMMRKLIHVAFGVLKSGKPFDAALHGA